MPQAPAQGADALYQEALANGRFVIQRCSACTHHVFYPRQLCPHCGADTLQWVEPSGRGTVYSTTTVRLNPAAPHEVSLIELEEGVRLMSRVRNVAPGELAIGTRVTATVVRENDTALLVFDAMQEAA